MLNKIKIALFALLLSGCACLKSPVINEAQLVELIDALNCKSYQCEVIRCEASLSWYDFWTDCEEGAGG